MEEAGLQEVETYLSRRRNTLAQYIATRPIIDLWLAKNWRPGPRLAMQWWEQEVLYLEGMRTEAQEGERTKGGEETYRTETVTDDQKSDEDTVVKITLGGRA